jgi:hypothetical protein
MDNTTKTIKELYEKYGLESEDIFPHKHFTIITRQGIEKIEAKAKIKLDLKEIEVSPTYCAMKCTASIEGKEPVVMFGSALNDPKLKMKNCQSTYLLEMSQKRSISRAVLKLCGFYTLGHFGEDEADDFKKATPTDTQRDGLEIKRIIEELRDDSCTLERAREIYTHYNSKYERDAKWGAILDVALHEYGELDMEDAQVDEL